MSNAKATIPDAPHGCNTGSALMWVADLIEAMEDEEFAEDAIHSALNEGLIDYPTAYRLRMGDGL